MKQHHRRYQRRTEPSRRGFSNSRKGFSASRRERDQLEVQKCSLHLRGLPPKASNKDVEIWLCRTAQICLKCANGDPRLFQPIRRVTRMLNKTHNSSSFHIQLRDARIKQAIVQRLQSFKDLEDKRLYDFYGDQSTMIEIKDFDPPFSRKLKRQQELLRSITPTNKVGEGETIETET